jgi:hypothetical protein
MVCARRQRIEDGAVVHAVVVFGLCSLLAVATFARLAINTVIPAAVLLRTAAARPTRRRNVRGRGKGPGENHLAGEIYG